MAQRIYRQQFDHILHQIPSLSEKERAHLDKAFGSDLVNGIDEYDLKHKIDSLHFHEAGYGTEGYLDQSELSSLRQKLLSKMK